ncbi:MAG: hypothetical protein H0V29_03880 [Thermoleophilaceae bacterium]|nr:hypothetical protein [Thermoleophilaceae bacterium]
MTDHHDIVNTERDGIGGLSDDVTVCQMEDLDGWPVEVVAAVTEPSVHILIYDVGVTTRLSSRDAFRLAAALMAASAAIEPHEEES